MTNNCTLLYHLLFGGRIKDLADKFKLSKSNVHRILDKAKVDELYDWSCNKDGNKYEELIETYGSDILKYIASLSVKGPEILDTKLNKCKKVVTLPDIHYPYNISLTTIEKFLSDYKPDVLIYLGDLMELEYLSFFERDNKLIVGDKLKKEYDEIMRLMDKHIKLSGASEVYYVEGNHEYRVKRFLETYPAGTGFIEIPIAMRLKDRGITWVELNKWVLL